VRTAITWGGIPSTAGSYALLLSIHPAFADAATVIALALSGWGTLTMIGAFAEVERLGYGAVFAILSAGSALVALALFAANAVF
jgi:hypothetical protein